jgi:hypothetical protein
MHLLPEDSTSFWSTVRVFGYLGQNIQSIVKAVLSWLNQKHLLRRYFTLA